MRQNNAILLFALIAILAMSCGGCLRTTVPPASPIGDTALKALLASDKNVLMIDVRTPEEYEEGHIPGALNLPLGELSLRGAKKKAASIITDHERTLVLYCMTGKRTKKAALALKRLGYTNLRDLGRVSDWKGILHSGTKP